MKYFTKDIKTKTKKRGSNLKQKINKREINILTLKDAIENKFNLTKALNKKKTIIKEWGSNAKQWNKGGIISIDLKEIENIKTFYKKIKIKTQNQKNEYQIWNQNK